MAVDNRVASAWAQLVSAASNYASKNQKQLAAKSPIKWYNPKNPGNGPVDPYVANRAAAPVGNIEQLYLGSRDDWMRDKELTAAYGNYQNIARTVVHEDRGYIHKAPEPAPAPETSGRGVLRVDLDTSPVQTKDSVMYRNAGEVEESTIGEASRPNKRKPGLSSNLGINL